MKKFDEKYCIESFKRLLDVDSTTGQYEKIQDLAVKMCKDLGYKCKVTHKGGVLVDLGGEGNPLVITAHLDDLGMMVRHINADGTLNVCPVGGLFPMYCVTENVRVYTRDDKIYTGAVCRIPNSLHVTEDEITMTLPDFRKNVCVVLDNDVKNAEDVKKLGIETGDFIAMEPRFTMSNGYIKSRFVDDKAAAAVLFTLMKALKKDKVKLNRKVYIFFAMYEEIGHGTTWLPDGVKDVLAVDIAPMGPEQNSSERKVSIFAKDARFTYHDVMTNELRACAKKAEIDYVMDIFTPHYETDADGSIAAGYDIRHAAIGPGTSNSHGYERTHIDGLKNTYLLLMEYITE